MLMSLVILDGTYLIRCFLDATLVAYRNDTGMLETRPSKIAARFFRNKWDILYRIIILAPLYLIDANLGYIRLLMFVEFDDMQFLSNRFVTIILWPLKNGLYKYIFSKVFRTFFMLTLYVMLVSHISACIFILTEQIALQVDTEEGKHIDRYISVLYFIISTSTTVGYGDITIDHKAERLLEFRYSYQILLMLFSLVVNSLFYSLINITVNEAVYILDKPYEPLEEFEYWMTARVRKMKKSQEVNKFYVSASNNFKFSYHYSIADLIQYGEFIHKIKYTFKDTIKEYSARDLKQKFNTFFGLISGEATHKLIFHMRPVM